MLQKKLGEIQHNHKQQILTNLKHLILE